MSSNDSLDLDTRIKFYIFDEDETICKQEYKSITHSNPEEYIVIHESDIVSLHNDMCDCIDALFLVLDYASQNNDNGYYGFYENLSLIFKRLTRIGNLLDADLMKEQHKRGQGQNIKAIYIR
jgi:hypothetical protein